MQVLPFLGLLTRWLGGKPVLFEEFGAPSRPVLYPYPGEEDLAGVQDSLSGRKTAWPAITGRP